MFPIARQLILLMAIVANLLSWSIMTHRVFACSCAAPGQPALELENATVVFAGRVLALEVPGGPIVSSADPVKVKFQVQEVWKGPVQTQLVVTTSRSGASCGYEFVQGQEYLVYSRGTPPELTVSLCSRTQPFATADEDFTALGNGSHPTVETVEQSPRAQMPIIVIGIIVGVAVLLLVCGVAVKRVFSRSTS